MKNLNFKSLEKMKFDINKNLLINNFNDIKKEWQWAENIGKKITWLNTE